MESDAFGEERLREGIGQIVESVMAEEDGAGRIGVEDVEHTAHRAKQIDVKDRHIGADALDLLRIPERESVVVAHGEEDGILVAAVEEIERGLACHEIVGPVVAGPVLSRHERWRSEEEEVKQDRGGFVEGGIGAV